MKWYHLALIALIIFMWGMITQQKEEQIKNNLAPIALNMP